MKKSLAFLLLIAASSAASADDGQVVSEISVSDTNDAWLMFEGLEDDFTFTAAELREESFRAADVWDRIFEISDREELREQLREERMMGSQPEAEGTIAARFFSGPNPSDYAFRMTQTLLGSPATKVLSLLRDDVADPKDNYATGVTYMVHLASYMAMGFAGILLLLILFSSAMNALKAGNFSPFGEGNNAFMPFRGGMGAVGIIPLPDFGGLSLSQVFVLAVFLMGIGSGSAVMALMAKHLMANPLVAASIPSSQVHKLANGMLDMQVCGLVQHRLSQTAANPKEASLLRTENSRVRVEPFVHIGNINRFFNLDKRVSFAANVRDPGSCGRIESVFPAGLIQEDGTLDLSRDDNVGFFGSWGRDPALAAFTNDQWATEFFSHMLGERMMAADGPLANLWFDLEPLAKLAVAEGLYPAEHARLLGRDVPDKALTMKDIEQDATMLYWHAVDRYRMAVNAEIATVANSREMQNIVDEMTLLTETHGMLFGGAYYYLIQRQQNAMAQAVEQSTPSVRAIDLDRLANSTWFGDQYRSFVRGVRRLLGRAGGNPDSDMIYARNFLDTIIKESHVSSEEPSAALRSYNRATSGDTAIGNAVAAFGEAFAEKLKDIPRMGENSSRLNPDPLLEIQSMGNKIFQAAQLIMAYEDWQGESVLNASSEDGRSPLFYVLVAAIMSLLGALAFLYSSLIPSLPFVMFTISALGLFIYLLQALVAAPIWWAMHANPRGDELLGGAGTGWKLMAGLYLRPPLMVMGLLGSMALIRLFGGFINEMFGPTVAIMNDGFFGVGFINQLVLYGIVMLVVTYKTFALIYDLQQTVMSWIGVEQAYTDFGEKEAQMKVIGLGAMAQGAATKRI